MVEPKHKRAKEDFLTIMDASARFQGDETLLRFLRLVYKEEHNKVMEVFQEVIHKLGLKKSPAYHPDTHKLRSVGNTAPAD